MNIPDKMEFKEKRRRVRDFFDKTAYEAMIIGRQDNFAWYTCGGNNSVIITSEIGCASLVLTKDKDYVIAQYMDCQRIIDEELQGLDIEPINLKWYEISREEKAANIIKGLRTISDIPIEGAILAPNQIYELHYPLTEKEMGKCRWIGNKTEEIISKVAEQIRHRMSEHEIEVMFLYEYGKHKMTPEVLLIGSDYRLSKYRHPNPSDKKVDKLILLHPAVRKWGLHANVTRMVYLGDKVPEDVIQKYEMLNLLQAQTMSMCVPGEKFSKIFNSRKELLKNTEFKEEWRYHYPGGITGYMLCDATICAKHDAEVVINQTYDWFITLTGVKVEELSANTSRGIEMLSVTGKWPTKEYTFNEKIFRFPQILLK